MVVVDKKNLLQVQKPSKNLIHTLAKGTSHLLNSPKKSIYSTEGVAYYVVLSLKHEHKILNHLTHITAPFWTDTVVRTA